MSVHVRQWISSIGVFFLFSFLAASAFFSYPNLFGFDSYYHAKHSFLIWQAHTIGLVRPWVNLHFLSTMPVDPYFLSHFLQGQLIGFFGIITGTKIFYALIIGFIFLVLYTIFCFTRVPHPLLWTLVAATSSTTFFGRLMLNRPFLFSIALLPLIFLFLIKKQYVAMAITTILYVLLYNLGIFVIPLVTLYICVDFVIQKKINLWPWSIASGAVLVGLLIHPDTINYLHLIYLHVIGIWQLKLSGIQLSSGGEIDIENAITFLQKNILTLSVTIISSSAFIAWKKYIISKNDRTILWSLFLLTSGWLLVSIVYIRGVEYWVPFLWFFAAYLYHTITKLPTQIQIPAIIQHTIHKQWFPYVLCMVLLVATVPFTIIKPMSYIYSFSQYDKKNLADYASANTFLIANTPKNSVVYYPNWSMFPRMFFFNTHNRYIAAFDPVFLYDYNHETYWAWYNFSSQGIYCTHQPPCLSQDLGHNLRAVPVAIHTLFNTNTIIVNKKLDASSTLLWLLKTDKHNFTRIYHNDEIIIYHINNQ